MCRRAFVPVLSLLPFLTHSVLPSFALNTNSVTRTKEIIIEASKRAPAKFQPWIAAFAWVIALIGLAFSLVAPVCNVVIAILSRVYKLLKPWHCENLLEAVFGLFVAFFGGSFFLVVASAEAWRAATWEENKKDLRIIYEDALKVHDANKKGEISKARGCVCVCFIVLLSCYISSIRFVNFCA
jgi:hypothetical protein